MAKPIFTVSVRDLVEFVHRAGDLGGDSLFVRPNRALAGTLGHQWLQRSRPAGYQKEVSLAREVEGDNFILRIQGRLDGVILENGLTRLEEIKTVGRGWDGVPDPLHWAQAKIYGCIYAEDNQLPAIDIQLAYLDLDTRKVTEFRETHLRQELSTFFAETVAVYQKWMEEQFAWRQIRDASIRALAFPFAHYRPGQRELAVAAYKTLVRGGRLFVEAPTGIGKTISALFPAVKALGEGKLERVFYLTATTVGRTVAEKAAADLRRAGLRLRTLTLTAKAQLCRRDGQPCDQRTCPLALGYYDRRRPAMRAALALGEITRPVLEQIGNEHQVCPFELSLDLSEWVEVVICDYNYVFDPKVWLRRHFAEDGGAHGFLVDEAHNLVNRAREMYSAELNDGEFREAAKLVKKTVPRCAKALRQLAKAWKTLAAAGRPGSEPDVDFADPHEPDLFANAAQPESNEPDQSDAGKHILLRDGVRASRKIPGDLSPLLEEFLAAAAEWLARNEASDFREPLLELYFRAFSFARTAELYDERYAMLIKPGDTTEVKLFCVDPSQLLKQALERGRGAVFFSATFSPLDYHRRLLGGEEGDVLLQLPSPFPPENLCVLVQDRFRTQFKDRANSLGEVVREIGTVISGRKGNYLVYLPSHQYLAAVVAEFEAQFPNVSIVIQRPGMSEDEREKFLAAFAIEHGRALAGFAVMGGIFGEGIDLVGERLIGAVIVGVGLPQLDAERDLIAQYFQAHGAGGFDYAYTFPGMNRVLQAIGRVIRSETDRGAALLIDARFGEARYRRLFPPWWRVLKAGAGANMSGLLQQFWNVE